jgi:hypothetical protein
LRGLFDADPVELAGRAFPMVFGGSNLVSPVRESDQLDFAVAGLVGLPFGTGFLGLVGRGEWERLQPITMEIICLWQQALVAGQRTIGSDHARHYLVLLRRGAAMLQVPDPVGFLRNALEGHNPLR